MLDPKELEMIRQAWGLETPDVQETGMAPAAGGMDPGKKGAKKLKAKHARPRKQPKK